MAQPLVTFGKPKQQPQAQSLPGASEDILALARRLRTLEERNTSLRIRLQVLEQNMLSKSKNTSTEIKTINSDMIEIKSEITEVKDKILLLIKELDSFAKREELDVLKRYLELWQPINFVTQKEVQEIVREELRKLLKR